MGSEQPDVKKVPLWGYYQSLTREERRQFKEAVQEALLCSHSSLCRWINGEALPSRSRAKAIAGVVGQPLEKLFPKYQ